MKIFYYSAFLYTFYLGEEYTRECSLQAITVKGGLPFCYAHANWSTRGLFFCFFTNKLPKIQTQTPLELSLRGTPQVVPFRVYKSYWDGVCINPWSHYVIPTFHFPNIHMSWNTSDIGPDPEWEKQNSLMSGIDPATSQKGSHSSTIQQVP